ncbi:MAG: sulfotransferase domain-containing protein [Simkaniaceae bacterium]|nr:MAG: sulfotransferase domain-containing protein [Simkaniaceae bacterium]
MRQSLFILFITLSISCFGEPIIFNTLPKSGSVYIGKTLSEGLKEGDFMTVSNNTFPTDPISLTKFEILMENDSITQEHFDASKENLEILKEKFPKLIVHVRDPRQALISWTHHLNKIQHSEEAVGYFLLTLPKTYFRWSFSRQLNWQIKHYFPACIDWIQNWVKASEDESLNILFTTYEDFLANPKQFFMKIFDFYSISDSIDMLPMLPKKSTYHFRKGKVDEWREAMTKSQQRKVTKMIPKELFDKFNWEP